MKKILIIVGAVLVIGAIGYGAFTYFSSQNKQPTSEVAQQPQPQGFNKTLHSIDEPGGLWWIVNKKRPIPEGYEPTDLVTPNIKLRWQGAAESMQVSRTIAAPLEAMHQAMTTAGLDV